MKKIDLSKVSKKSKMIAAVAFVLGATTLGAGMTHAQVTKSPNDPMSLLIDTIAQKFNLNSSEVESVVKEVLSQEHQKMEDQMKKDFTNRLTQAVTDGKLTQSQADLITAKQLEIRAYAESLKDMDQAARHTAMKSYMENTKKWVDDNNIPKEYIMFGGNHNGQGRPNFLHKMNQGSESKK